jgi:glycosyltransferase involved in cell wall biosynthesis
VLHIVLDLHAGGLERVVADLMRHVDPARFDNHVLALRFLGRNAQGLGPAARLHVADPLPPWTMLWPQPLIRQIREIAPDVVHTHSGVWYKASLAARWAGARRLIHTDHGRPYPDPWTARLLDRLAAPRTDVIVAVSEALARQLATAVAADPSRIVVVPNGVDVARFRSGLHDSGLHRALGLDPAAPIIGSVGRLDPVKAYDVMLDAFARLRGEWRVGPAPVLVVVGDGPEGARLAGLVEAHRLQGAAHMLGWRDDIERVLSSFDVFSLASRSEGTSVSLLEAMSAGVCPVVTEVGGNRAVLGGELAHRLVPSGDAQALADAWLAALQDRERRCADGQAARRRVVERFSLDAMIRAYERLYLGESGADLATG